MLVYNAHNPLGPRRASIFDSVQHCIDLKRVLMVRNGLARRYVLALEV